MTNLVTENADLVEQLRGTGKLWSVTWHAGDAPQERIALLDHHGAVLNELRRRGHHARATVVRDEPNIEHFAIVLEDPDETAV